jgi:hypothetical protein
MVEIQMKQDWHYFLQNIENMHSMMVLCRASGNPTQKMTMVDLAGLDRAAVLLALYRKAIPDCRLPTREDALHYLDAASSRPDGNRIIHTFGCATIGADLTLDVVDFSVYDSRTSPGTAQRVIQDLRAGVERKNIPD